MIVNIEFGAREEAWLTAQAAQQGVPTAEIVKNLVDAHLPAAPEREEIDPTLALFARWDKEDADRTPEEAEANEQMWREFEQNINATRQELGMRTL